MPYGLKRFQRAEALHVITFRCFHRLPFRETPAPKKTVEAILEQTGSRHVDGEASRPTHRDKAAMNGAQPSFLAYDRSGQDRCLGHLPFVTVASHSGFAPLSRPSGRGARE
jgi:hypothetical protein